VAIPITGAIDRPPTAAHYPSAVSQRIRALEGATARCDQPGDGRAGRHPHGEWLVRLDGRRACCTTSEPGAHRGERGRASGGRQRRLATVWSMRCWRRRALGRISAPVHVEDETPSAELLRSGDVLAR